MNIIQITAFLFLLGIVLLIPGFGAIPPILYTGKDIQQKLNLLAAMPGRWILSQSLVILASLVSMAASVSMILLFRESQVILLAVIGTIAFFLGHVFWIWQVGLRLVEPPKFAKNELPGWLFNAYSILTLLGLAGYGVAFWLQGNYRALGIGTILGALLILGLFLKLKGMPPIVYYTLTLAIGLTLLF
jgi:hypothetical protein